MQESFLLVSFGCRCGQWRERLGVAQQICPLAIEAVRASSSHGCADVQAPPGNSGGNLGSQHTAAAAGVTAMLGSLRCSSPFSSLGAQGEVCGEAAHGSAGEQGHGPRDEETPASCGQSVCVAAVLHAASVLLRDPVWAVRRAAAMQLFLLSRLRHKKPSP